MVLLVVVALLGSRMSRFFPGLNKNRIAASLFCLATMPACGSGNSKASTPSESSADEDESEEDAKPSSTSSSDEDNGSKSEVKESESEDQDPGQEEPEAVPSTKFDLGAMPKVEKNKGELRPCEIDFLFVVDNSISMEKEQAGLASAVPKFIKTMMESKPKNPDLPKLEKNYHIGVVTTDEYEHNKEGCRFLGGLVTQVERETKQPNGTTKRELLHCGPFKSKRNYMSQDDDLSRTFDCAARPGISGSIKERQIGALLAAVDPKNAGPGRCNEGFLREEGLLVAVIISDEDAIYEDGGPEQWRERLLKIKGGDEKKVVIVSIVVPKDNMCGPSDTMAVFGDKIIEFTRSFSNRGFVGDVCSPSYTDIFSKAVGIIDFACGELVEPAG